MTQLLKRQNMLKLSIMNDENIKRKVQVVVFAEEEVLMMEFNPTLPHNYVGFQNITGSVDPGEDFLTAAKRELFEESGINSNVVELDLTYEFTDRWQKQCFEKIYFCKLSTKPQITLCSEHLNYKWMNINQVKARDYRFLSNYEAFEAAKKYINTK